MKRIPTDLYSFTEIGGVGEMIYKAVRFPEYLPEYDYTSEQFVMVPVFTGGHRVTADTDYSITGQGLLSSLCNLYQKINDPKGDEPIANLLWDWCRNNIQPYNINELCKELETRDFLDIVSDDNLKRLATFALEDFISDLCKLGSVFEYYYALQRIKYYHDAQIGRELYYEGRCRDSVPHLEKYRKYTDDDEYVRNVVNDYDERMSEVMDMFPAFRLRLMRNSKTDKIEMGAEIDSVFDIAWYAFARMVAYVAPPADADLNYMYSQGSILTCMACGEYFVRHSSNQRYCDNPNCQAERKNRKARAYYLRKKAKK
jgi:hypothetical protein